VSLSSLSFQIEEAGKNIRRNGLMSLAALTTVTIAMAVLGGSLFALYRLHQFAEAQPRQFEMQVFLTVETPREKVLEIKQRLESLPGVAHVRLYTKEQAWTEMQQQDREQQTKITEAIGGVNPLPDRLDVRLLDPRRTAGMAKLLRDPAQFPEVHRVFDAREELEQLLAVARLVRNIGGAAAILLFLATALVIQNTIRLTVFARRREIRIMQLVGATPGFIRFPLVLEGIFYGAAGAAIAAGLVLFVVYQVSLYAAKVVTPLQYMPPSVGPWAVAGLLIALGAAVGWAGSVLSIRRFLKRI
jgi:cell division transport system permease protein